MNLFQNVRLTYKGWMNLIEVNALCKQMAQLSFSFARFFLFLCPWQDKKADCLYCIFLCLNICKLKRTLNYYIPTLEKLGLYWIWLVLPSFCDSVIPWPVRWKFSSHLSQVLWGLESWNLVPMWTVGGWNQASAAYSSLNFFIFLSHQFSNIKMFCHTFLRNCEDYKVETWYTHEQMDGCIMYTGIRLLLLIISDILSLMEPKIGNFVFHTFMYISVFTEDFQELSELATKIIAKNSKIHTNLIFHLRCH